MPDDKNPQNFGSMSIVERSLIVGWTMSRIFLFRDTLEKNRYINSINVILGHLGFTNCIFQNCLEMVRLIRKRAKKQGAFLNIAQVVFSSTVYNWGSPCDRRWCLIIYFFWLQMCNMSTIYWIIIIIIIIISIITITNGRWSNDVQSFHTTHG